MYCSLSRMDIHILIASWCPLKNRTSEIRHTNHVLFILAWLFDVHLQYKGLALLCPVYNYIINNIEMLSERKPTSNWTPRCLQITEDWYKTHSFQSKYIIYLMWISGSECCAKGPAASLEKRNVECINVVICYYRLPTVCGFEILFMWPSFLFKCFTLASKTERGKSINYSCIDVILKTSPCTAFPSLI